MTFCSRSRRGASRPEADVGVGGEVHDGVGAAHDLDHPVGLDEEVARDRLEVRVGASVVEVTVETGGEVVDRHDVMSVGEEGIDQVRPDEPGTTRDHDAHRREATGQPRCSETRRLRSSAGAEPGMKQAREGRVAHADGHGSVGEGLA